MGITFVQAAAISNTGSSNLSLAYSEANTAGAMGVAWLFTANGTLPGSVTDSNGNTWCSINSNQNSTYSVGVFVCASLKAGNNTVSASFGDSPTSGTPSMHILEYTYTGPCTLMALQVLKDFTLTNTTFIECYYNQLVAGAQQSVTVGVFLAIYDFGSVHGWEGSLPSYPRIGSSEAAVTCSVSGDAIISSAGIETLFDCQFYNPAPMPPPYNTRVVGFALVTTP